MADGFRRLLANNPDWCPVCCDSCLNPKILECLHALCENCAAYVSRGKKPGETFQCPICRQEIKFPEGGIANLYDVEHLRRIAPTWLKAAGKGTSRIMTQINNSNTWCE